MLDGGGDQMTPAGGLECLGSAANSEVVRSVPPLVNTISEGSPLMSKAMADRASSMAAFACCPKWWTLEALPKDPGRPC